VSPVAGTIEIVILAGDAGVVPDAGVAAVDVTDNTPWSVLAEDTAALFAVLYGFLSVLNDTNSVT
tara:strand:- start:15 stop:209 length:195 start_codon:yes stop_codon:yes gene_type:complete